MKNIKLLSFVGFFFLTLSNLIAQGAKDKFFISLGYTSCLDFFQLPTQNKITGITTNNSQLIGQYQADNYNGLSFFAFGTKLRYNLVDINDNQSISIHVFPVIGFSLASGANDASLIGNLSVPIMIGFNTGNISTYSTGSNKGFGIAAGVEYFNGGLITTDDNVISEINYTDQNGQNKIYKTNNKIKPSKLFAPVLELSYRYWNKKNKAHELALQIHYGGLSKLETDSIFTSIEQSGEASNSYHFRLIWSQYLHY